MLRTVLGLDLSGRLASWRKRYDNSLYAFDYSRVDCTVHEGAKGWTVHAGCHCTDPKIFGWDMQTAPVYVSRLFRSAADADTHLGEEVRRAAKPYADSSFYR
jgi:hypothetical protein